MERSFQKNISDNFNILNNLMKTKIFINLPTKDLDKATAFYEEIGFTKNPKFSDENAS